MSTLQLPGPLVDVDWLHSHLDAPNLIVFDGSWHMPATHRNAFEEWQHEHIRNARFFDFDRIIYDSDSELPHMMPDADKFTREVQKLGLSADNIVVVYDTMCMFTAPRVWWMLRAMGFENCALLNGGLPAWHRAGYEVDIDATPGNPPTGSFVAKPVERYFCNAESVVDALDDSAISIVDARPAPRYLGEVDEPRAGLRRGHMPGASNLPFPDLFEHGLMKPKEELQAMLSGHFPRGKHTICSCGSGVTACVVAFAAHLLGNDDVTVYDGSWSEWGMPGDLPVVSD